MYVCMYVSVCMYACVYMYVLVLLCMYVCIPFFGYSFIDSVFPFSFYFVVYFGCFAVVVAVVVVAVGFRIILPIFFLSFDRLPPHSRSKLQYMLLIDWYS